MRPVENAKRKYLPDCFFTCRLFLSETISFDLAAFRILNSQKSKHPFHSELLTSFIVSHLSIAESQRLISQKATIAAAVPVTLLVPQKLRYSCSFRNHGR